MSQIDLSKAAQAADATPEQSTWQIATDLAYKRVGMVNVAFYGPAGAGDRGWVLIDAGLPGTAGALRRAANERFGDGTRPRAIILTHAHIDHVGGLEELNRLYDAPIYVHPKELPYVNGSQAYPPPDKKAGGGIMPAMAGLFPRGPFDFANVHPLPEDGAVPAMPGWEWIHVPGHTEGQVALYRRADGILLSADAVITTRQESAYAVLTQKPEMHGPPAYFTSDWDAARESVQKLAALEPQVLLGGHGRAMEGPAMREALHALAHDFDRVARPHTPA